MFQIDVMSRKPIYEQIVDQMERLVLIKLLKPNEKLPSVRHLSVELSLNPNTIQKAYTELDRRGVISSVPGRGCFVSGNAILMLEEHRKEKLEEMKNDLGEMRLAGISKEVILNLVDDVYESELESIKSEKEGIS